MNKSEQGLEWRLNVLIVYSALSVVTCWHFPNVCVYMLITQLMGLASYIHYEYTWLSHVANSNDTEYCSDISDNEMELEDDS